MVAGKSCRGGRKSRSGRGCHLRPFLLVLGGLVPGLIKLAEIAFREVVFCRWQNQCGDGGIGSTRLDCAVYSAAIRGPHFRPHKCVPPRPCKLKGPGRATEASQRWQTPGHTYLSYA